MLDEALIEAVAEVCSEDGQPASVAKRLTAWLKQKSESDLSKDENTQFLLTVCSALEMDESNAN